MTYQLESFEYHSPSSPTSRLGLAIPRRLIQFLGYRNREIYAELDVDADSKKRSQAKRDSMTIPAKMINSVL